jgi:hypothetical protein
MQDYNCDAFLALGFTGSDVLHMYAGLNVLCRYYYKGY